MKHLVIALSALILLTGVQTVRAETVLMSGDWGRLACDAWNAEPVLTDKLAESGWASNDKGRGQKVLQIYRSDCGDKPTTELRISNQNNKAQCVYGGGVESVLDLDVDYLMNAKTNHWVEMGAGDYGPMWAMTSFKLKFKGPEMEAMNNMEPFEKFLLLAGVVPASSATCP
jgi:putative sterol carrier protein